MCGIIAYNGPRDAAEVALQGLKTLEYRGYDSWGIVTLSSQGSFFMTKNPGKIGEIKFSELKHPKSSIGMGHTRWATHGGVNQRNAHPHLSQSERFAVVQNGIVENFDALKSQLKSKGYKFKSETDTEVIANLIEEEHTRRITRKGKQNNVEFTFREAVRQAFLKLEGRNAIAVLDKETGEIVAARQGSPLIVGVRKNEYFIASDIPAFLEYTNKVMYLDDGQMAVVNSKLKMAASRRKQNSKLQLKTQSLIKFYDIKSGREIKRRIVEVDLKPEQAEKGNYPHFMIKEIKEQKDTILRAINQNDKLVKKVGSLIQSARGCYLIAAGTAGKVCHYAEYLFAEIAHRHVNFCVASEFKNFIHFLTAQSLVIVVSQSGETADVLEPMESAKKMGAKVIAIINVPGSSIARKADYTFLINAGPEKAVASTKATTAQMSVAALLAYAMAGELKEGKRGLVNLAGSINDLLNPRYEKHILTLARRLQKSKDIFIIGRGVNYPIALESEIKLMEVSYIHAQGFAGGELKHGPIALIEKGTPTIVLSADNDTREEILSNAKEIKARGGYIIGVGPFKELVYDYWLRVPNVPAELSAIINLIPIQILAYHLAVLRGCDPDKPRNLAKSVSVK